ncbi:alpha/beta-hydrolase [Cucurbitaria berberidis CBS 394.84]|uniref:Alpha/beta-hydrolase n=1 Tax=Cucurbitaria berberidis CBS 394.84 TaxID=1168544 RepID=A0A9P4GEV1_9PLEO|nr:alpha/beta-hydrolase [Cucurbitaria berberidis CBS 394.84]KAF1843939.1 alpha/beta-hydrolase [Cucurbitaria berberidis CBS 394.84]
MTPVLGLVLLLVTTSLSLCVGAKASPSTDKPAVILVPGAFHRASVYDQVKTSLKKSGYRHVDAIDLPSVGPLASYVDRTPDIALVRTTLVARLLQGKDVVLVGNSYGATVIGEAVRGLQSMCVTTANTPRGKILGLIMLSGFIPYIRDVSHPLSRTDIRTFAPPWFRFEGTSRVYWDAEPLSSPPSLTFYNLLAPAQAAYWSSKLAPSSFTALNATATYIPYMGDFRCLYVIGERDNCVPPALAQSYIDQDGAVFETLVIDGDHLPMLSRPEKTVEIIRRFSGEAL